MPSFMSVFYDLFNCIILHSAGSNDAVIKLYTKEYNI